MTRTGYVLRLKWESDKSWTGDLSAADLQRLLSGDHPELCLKPTILQEGRDVATTVAAFVNSTCAAEEEFVATMGQEHRTLQQGFSRLCLRWLYHIGQQKHWDLRNEASVVAGRRVMEALGPCGWSLPTV